MFFIVVPCFHLFSISISPCFSNYFVLSFLHFPPLFVAVVWCQSHLHRPTSLPGAPGPSAARRSAAGRPTWPRCCGASTPRWPSRRNPTPRNERFDGSFRVVSGCLERWVVVFELKVFYFWSTVWDIESKPFFLWLVFLDCWNDSSCDVCPRRRPRSRLVRRQRRRQRRTKGQMTGRIGRRSRSTTDTFCFNCRDLKETARSAIGQKSNLCELQVGFMLFSMLCFRYTLGFSTLQPGWPFVFSNGKVFPLGTYCYPPISTMLMSFNIDSQPATRYDNPLEQGWPAERKKS